MLLRIVRYSPPKANLCSVIISGSSAAASHSQSVGCKSCSCWASPLARGHNAAAEEEFQLVHLLCISVCALVNEWAALKSCVLAGQLMYF